MGKPLKNRQEGIVRQQTLPVQRAVRMCKWINPFRASKRDKSKQDLAAIY